MLVNFQIIIVCACHSTLLETLCEEWEATGQNNEEAAVHEHGQFRAIRFPWNSTLSRLRNIILVYYILCIVVENHLIAHDPEAEAKEGQWSPLKYLQSLLVKLRAIYGWHLIPICDVNLLNYVDVDKC